LPTIRALYWDIGGVLLNNAWDHNERAEALSHFEIDEREFHSRHEMLVSSFERGKITLDDYLDRTIFFCRRPFSRDAFREYMFGLSKPLPGMLEFAQSLSSSGKYLMGTINNESRELNDYRIEKFGLRSIFRVFVSSCFVGLRKPEPDIYRLALDITQLLPQECCFIDDRALNVESAAKTGMRSVQMLGLEPLQTELEKLGVMP
jgi:putative hydrolase of the HAD superfamily